MKTIHKYKISVGVSKFALPTGSEFLRAQLQDGQMILWVLKTDEFEVENFVITVVGTGWDVPTHIKKIHFVDTVQFLDGTVWHVFAHPSRMPI